MSKNKAANYNPLDYEDNLDDAFPSYGEPSKPTVKLNPIDLEDQGPIISPEAEAVIHKFYDENPALRQKEDAWIQTYSGRRFYPTNPYVDAIVIQDIAHALSMQCRFSGHVKKFYSVAQHCVLVSYICDFEDALWGLLHDASEAYLVDVPSPLKRSGKFDAYITFEKQMQDAICKRFNLDTKEPPSVKRADKLLLATEARDLMGPLHTDWVQPCEPLPFTITPLPPEEAKDLFMKRFFELTDSPDGYAHYLAYKDKA